MSPCLGLFSDLNVPLCVKCPDLERVHDFTSWVLLFLAVGLSLTLSWWPGLSWDPKPHMPMFTQAMNLCCLYLNPCVSWLSAQARLLFFHFLQIATAFLKTLGAP